MKRWSDAQIEALLELELASGNPHVVRVEEPAPLPVKSGCICPNGHEPDQSGFIVTSPSCIMHGCRSRFAPTVRFQDHNHRTVGSIHSLRGQS